MRSHRAAGFTVPPHPRRPGPGTHETRLRPPDLAAYPASGRLTAGKLRSCVLLLGIADHVLSQAGRQADRRGRLLPGLHVRRGDVHDAVGIDLESDLDPDLATIRDAKSGELELAEH